MMGSTKVGLLILAFITLGIVVGLPNVFGGPAAGESAGGNWSFNASMVTYPTNKSNLTSNIGNLFNFTFNNTAQVCIGEIWNETGGLNVTGEIVTVNIANDTCQINVTNSSDTLAGIWNNVTAYFYNDTNHGLEFFSEPIQFRIDSTDPIVTISTVRQNNTAVLYDNVTTNIYQDWINISITLTDETTDNANLCKVIIEHETFNSTGYNVYKTVYQNLTTMGQDIVKEDTYTSNTRLLEARVPAEDLTNGEYQGKFFLSVECTDAMGNVGTSERVFGAINKINTNTWTPLASLNNDTNTYNWLWANSPYGNISYIAVLDNSTKTFKTHRWNTSTNNDIFINMDNQSAFYVYAANPWYLARFNNTILNSTNVGNATIDMNNTNSSWGFVGNYQTNTSKWIAKNCNKLNYTAFFNSTDTTCLGGCWETYYTGYNYGAENKTIPFGSAYWIKTLNTTVESIVWQPSVLSEVGLCV